MELQIKGVKPQDVLKIIEETNFESLQVQGWGVSDAEELSRLLLHFGWSIDREVNPMRKAKFQEAFRKGAEKVEVTVTDILGAFASIRKYK